MFWRMDTYYLQLERMYRRKYKWVLDNRLKTFDYAFDLNPENKAMWLEIKLNEIGNVADKSVNYYAVQWSPTLSIFYLPFLVVSCMLFGVSNNSFEIKGFAVITLFCFFIIAIVIGMIGNKNYWGFH